MGLHIRPLSVKDYEQVRKLDLEEQRRYLGQKFYLLSPEEQEKHLVVSQKPEFQISVDTGYCFVAEENERIIGILFAYEKLPFRGHLFVQYVCIDPDYQRRGVATLLYKNLIEKAKENYIQTIQGLINLDNAKSIAFHEKVGFKIRDQKEAILYLDNS